ncbi:MAG: putative 7-carboxy-7-deazaguanine synthase QueE [Eubacterium sp.]|nr:putative 7-carboxy-7-deazaguanine synthase QueE [Eubacterium sp.]
MYKVAEWFVSINGEGRRAGEPAVFIRFVGCNLACSYCDTAWAISENAEHKERTLEEIIEYVENSGITNVTLTGGEPLLQNGIEDIVLELIGRNHRVEIETNGAVSIKAMYNLADKYSMMDELSVTLDYKCPGSGMEAFMDMDNYEHLRPEDTVKFVVCDRSDLDKAREIIEKYDLVERCAVYLSPVFGRIESREIVEYMIEHKMNGVKHQLQQHKFIWPPDARGV